MLVVGSKSNLGCEAGCGLTVSFSDHARIGPALEMTFHEFSNIFFEILQCHFSWQAQYLVQVDSDFSWQVQHFVTFWEIAGARNVVFFNIQNCRGDRTGKLSEAAGAR